MGASSHVAARTDIGATGPRASIRVRNRVTSPKILIRVDGAGACSPVKGAHIVDPDVAAEQIVDIDVDFCRGIDRDGDNVTATQRSPHLPDPSTHLKIDNDSLKS
jgi:hypothetical protein